MIETREKSSFRDPSGFIFRESGVVYRQVNRAYEQDFNFLNSSGLYDWLTQAGWLVKTDTVPLTAEHEDSIALLRPEVVPFISYPFEWSFSQLKDAALATLEIQELALNHGMVLKDASAFNIQFMQGKPVLIDSLSFEIYKEGMPWIAYRQFCRHFLAPLALMSYVDVRLGRLSALHIDGVPLDLASKLLPGMSKLKAGLLTHIHIHAKAESHVAGDHGKGDSHSKPGISKTGMMALVDSLKGTVSSLHWSPVGTEWGNYYEATNYSVDAMGEKHKLVDQAIEQLGKAGDSCWDLGANNGEFSRLASRRGLNTVAWDIDPGAVEKNYLQMKAGGETNLLPLLQDLINPSPSLGWSSNERSGMIERGPADVVLALALIHHLAIGNNVPFPMIVEFFAKVGRSLIVEFVPKEDSQVQRMLSNREDIFNAYDIDSFRDALAASFELVGEWPIPDTVRTLFVLRKRG